MATKNYTATELIDDIRRRASIPNTNALASDQDLVDFLDEEMSTVIVPEMMSVREEFFVDYVDTATVVGTVLYDLPTRAIGSKLRDVTIVTTNSNGYETETNMPRLTPEQISGRHNIVGSYGFYLQGTKIGIFPTPTEVFTLRIKYFRRPGRLIKEANAAQVVTLNSSTGLVTLSNALPSTVITGSSLDFVGQSNPFSSVGDDFTVSATGSLSVTVTPAASLDNVSVGDWVCESTFSPIPQIPFEAHDVLVQAAIVKFLESVQDPSVKTAQAKYDQKKELFLDMLKDRVEGQPKKCIGSSSILNYTQRHRFTRLG